MYGERNRERLNTATFKKRVKELAEEQIAVVYADLEEEVRKELSGAIKEIIPAVLGLENRWGRWELNRTNGIDEKTPAGIALSERLAEQSREIVAEALADWKPPKALLKAIKAAYNENLNYALVDIAQNMAHQHAEEWGETFVNTTLKALDEKPVGGDEVAERALLARLYEKYGQPETTS